MARWRLSGAVGRANPQLPVPDSPYRDFRPRAKRRTNRSNSDMARKSTTTHPAPIDTQRVTITRAAETA